jgi:hypothetical protein
MTRTEVSRTIHAPLEKVFDTVAHIERFSEVVPEIVEVELLSDTRRGVGTRFRETRLMGKRRASSVLEVTEYVPNERVRLVSDQGGTLWDTVFTTRPAGQGAVELTMVMDAQAYKLPAKLLIPLIMGIVRKAIGKDLDAVKRHCEA